jgi:hypothetical protein
MDEFTLPSIPQGDPLVPDAELMAFHAEHGDYESGDAELGGPEGHVSFAQMGDLPMDEVGAPIQLSGSAQLLASRLAHGTPTQVAHAVAQIAKHHGQAKARAVRARHVVRHLNKNHGVLFERVAGGRVVSSTLGSGAHLTPSMIAELKHAIHGSVPFQPQVFPFVPSGPDVIVDIRTALNSVIGPLFPTYYIGFIITLQASIFNTNVGAFITVNRNLGNIPATLTLTQLIQLESGAQNVQILNLNGALIAGRPRVYAPQIFGSAVADPTTEVRIVGLPTNYQATLRFLQPGDAQVNHLLHSL